MNKGILYALFAYIFWGIFPIYWKLLKHVPSYEIVAERVVWSLAFFLFIIWIKRDWSNFVKKIRSIKSLWQIVFPAILIAPNWFVFIWAVTGDYVLETSLGYFISPLMSVFFGVVFLKESLRRIQWVAVIIAGMGVVFMTIMYGQFPWISVFLASTWATYGLLRKKSPLDAIEGLTFEMFILLIPALVFLTYLSAHDANNFGLDLLTTTLFIGGGIISGLPLLAFIAGARRINLTLIGILQYIYPTIIFFLGVYLYDEPFSDAKVMGFSFIWLALIVFTLEGTVYLRSKSLEFPAKKISTQEQ